MTPKALTSGQEQYEFFTSRIRRKPRNFVQYDFRTITGALFSTVKPTLKACRVARDKWLAKASFTMPRADELMDGLAVDEAINN